MILKRFVHPWTRDFHGVPLQLCQLVLHQWKRRSPGEPRTAEELWIIFVSKCNCKIKNRVLCWLLTVHVNVKYVYV